jgi:hypothetical protein
MPDLIISENNKLVRNDIITQSGAYGDVSNRYIPIATQEVLDVMRSIAGDIKIIGFNNAYVRKNEKEGFQKHAVMVEFNNAEMIDGTKMNMILFNSNDRSTSLKIFMGSLRMACSNQMVWGDQIAEPISIRHTNTNWKHSIYSLMESYEETQHKTQEMINNMMNRYVSYGDIGRISERVAEEIANPSIAGRILDPLQLNTAHRKEDVGKDLWHTYQRVQYNLLQGGVDRIIEKEDDNRLIEVISKTHKVTDTNKQINFNRELHNIMMEV